MRKFCKLYLVSIAVLLCISTALKAETLFEESFESGDFANWKYTTLVNGTADIVSQPVKFGSYAFKSTITANGGNWRYHKACAHNTFTTNPADFDVIFFKMYFNLSSDISTQSQSRLDLASLSSQAAGPVMNIGIIANNGTLVVTDRITQKRGTTVLNRDTWYCYEAEYNKASGVIRVWINGNLEYEGTGLTLSDINGIFVGWDTNVDVAGTVFYDQISVLTERKPYSLYDIIPLHAPFFGRIGLKIKLTLSGHSATDKFSVKLEGGNGYLDEQNFPAPLDGAFDVNLNFRNINTGDYTLTYTLMSENNEVLSKITEEFNKPYDGLPITGIDENTAVCVNGVPRFFVTPLCERLSSLTPWTEQKLINTHWGNEWNTQTLASYQDYLNKAATAGIGCIGPHIDATWVNKHPNYDVRFPNEQEIETYVKGVRDYPAHLMYSWCDEPITNFCSLGGSQDGMIQLMKDATATTHKHDPHRLVATSEWATYAGMEYSQRNYMFLNLVADVYSFDYYPIEHSFGSELGIAVNQYAGLCGMYHDWNYGLVPYFTWIEPCDVTPDGSKAYTPYPPTPEQLRMLCWIAIAKDTKGICWYHYSGETPAANYAVMTELTNMVEEYGDVILGPTPKDITVTDNANEKGSRVETMVRETENDIYIFAARVTEASGEWVDPLEVENLQVQFTLTGGPGTGVVEDVLYANSVVHEEFDIEAVGRNFSFNLSHTPVRPGSLVVGGGKNEYNGSAVLVGENEMPLQWFCMTDRKKDGSLKALPINYEDNSTGTIDYTTGELSANFSGNCQSGKGKVHVGYVPEGRKHTVWMNNNTFTDNFGLCAARVYRISKTPNAVVTSDETKGGHEFQIYPNPASQMTTIRYQALTNNCSVTLKVYDLQGKEVAVLLNEQLQSAGLHSVQWSPENLPNGLYQARLIIRQDDKDMPVVLTQKVLLTK